MIITYHGVDFFKVSFGDTTIAINPISKSSKLKSSTFGSDITLISLNSPEHNGADITSRGDKESFLINGPGEYEVSGVFIKGFLSKSNYGGEERINTIYTVNPSQKRGQDYGRGETRTLNPFRAQDFKSCAYTIPPLA
ncbi:MAG: Zn-dependent hydrolase of the metallo-beta-lactamase superfamily, partial [Parcubacteria group bacterium GW2011_GWB1_40_5]